MTMTYENRVLTTSALEKHAALHWEVPLEKTPPLETDIFRTLNDISNGLNDIFWTFGTFQWR